MDGRPADDLVSSYVKRLTSRGLVRTSPHPEDSRSYLIELSRSGVRTTDGGVGVFLPALEQVEAGLATQVRRISELLELGRS